MTLLSLCLTNKMLFFKKIRKTNFGSEGSNNVELVQGTSFTKERRSNQCCLLSFNCHLNKRFHIPAAQNAENPHRSLIIKGSIIHMTYTKKNGNKIHHSPIPRNSVLFNISQMFRISSTQPRFFRNNGVSSCLVQHAQTLKFLETETTFGPYLFVTNKCI